MSKWIPVNTRMPELEQEVFITFRNHRCRKLEVAIGATYKPGDSLYWCTTDGQDSDFDRIRVLAWQPLPAPYKEQK